RLATAPPARLRATGADAAPRAPGRWSLNRMLGTERSPDTLHLSDGRRSDPPACFYPGFAAPRSSSTSPGASLPDGPTPGGEVIPGGPARAMRKPLALRLAALRRRRRHGQPTYLRPPRIHGRRTLLMLDTLSRAREGRTRRLSSWDTTGRNRDAWPVAVGQT